MSYVGYQTYVLFGKESAYGVPVSATKDFGIIQNVTDNASNALRRIFGLGSVETQQIIAGKFDQTLTMESQFQHGRIFEFIMGGAVTHDSTNTPDIKHVFAAANSLPSMTLEKGTDVTSDVVKRYAGTKVGALTLGLALDGVASIKADLLAKSVATSTVSQPSIVSTLPVFPDFMGAVRTGALSSETTIAEVQNCEAVIRMTGEKLWGLGSRLPTANEMFQRQIEFSFTAGFNSVAEYEKFLGGTSPLPASTPTIPSFILDISNGVPLASGRRQIFLNLTGASYETFGEPTNVDGYILQDFVGWATTVNNLFTYDNIVSGSF